MIPMSRNDQTAGQMPKELRGRIRLLSGVYEPLGLPAEPFSEEAISFLGDLARALREDTRTPAYTDVAAFGFWCRRANLLRMKERLGLSGTRIGLGLAFHIAPSNVPVNFAYSYALGLLAGNANIVRVPSKEFAQTDILCQAVERVLAGGGYPAIREATSIVAYGHDKDVTDWYSSICDARIIWGGDETIQAIRESAIGSRCREVAFADRYSLGLIRPEAIANMDEGQLTQLAKRFYDDTYLMDQNACSSPHLIIWLTDQWRGTQQEKEKVQDRFWEAVVKMAGKYVLEPIKASEKYDRLCNFLADTEDEATVRRYGNLLYRVSLQTFKRPADTYRGIFGLFFEKEMESLQELASAVTKKVQTAAVCGISQEEVVQLIQENHLKGIDRVVPFGETLSMDLVWDGYDIIGSLSRRIG